MKKYRVYTRTHGNHDVEAYTSRQAVACVVARLKLSEDEARKSIGWAVSTAKQRMEADDATAS